VNAAKSDRRMEVLCEDNSGTYAPPFACHWANGPWLNYSADVAIEGKAVGWRFWAYFPSLHASRDPRPKGLRGEPSRAADSRFLHPADGSRTRSQ
jgi:hypothetical protein